MMVLKALAVSLFSWLAAIGLNLLTALILGVAGRSMSWFTHTSLLLPLYIVPALLAMAEVYSYWQKKVSASWSSQSLIVGYLEKRVSVFFFK